MTILDKQAEMIINSIKRDVKQAVVDIIANELDKYIEFENGSMNCFILASSGDYSILYIPTHNQLAVVWALRTKVVDNKLGGGWGQGYYFSIDTNANSLGDEVTKQAEFASNLFVSKIL